MINSRFFCFYGHTRYWGDGIWCKIFDTSNLSQMASIADICYVS